MFSLPIFIDNVRTKHKLYQNVFCIQNIKVNVRYQDLGNVRYSLILKVLL